MIRNLNVLSKDIDGARFGFFDTWKFGYLGEINSNHKTDYPLLLLLPPSSSFKDVYSSDETMTLTFHCYDVKPPVETPTLVWNDTRLLEKTFDNLLERFKGTIEALVLEKESQYILSGQWSIDRVSREFNDDLIGLVITIELNKYSFCLATHN